MVKEITKYSLYLETHKIACHIAIPTSRYTLHQKSLFGYDLD